MIYRCYHMFRPSFVQPLKGSASCAGALPQPLPNPMSIATQAYLRMASRSARSFSAESLADIGATRPPSSVVSVCCSCCPPHLTHSSAQQARATAQLGPGAEQATPCALCCTSACAAHICPVVWKLASHASMRCRWSVGDSLRLALRRLKRDVADTMTLLLQAAAAPES